MTNQKAYEAIQNAEMGAVTDFHIRSQEGDIFFCTKQLFVVKSDYFKVLFGDTFKKQDQKIWESKKPSFVVKALVKWVYLEEVEEGEVEDLLSIFEDAKFYQLPEMAAAYEEKICRGLSRENVVTILTTTQKFNAQEIKEKCIQFIIRKKVEVEEDEFGIDDLPILVELCNHLL